MRDKDSLLKTRDNNEHVHAYGVILRTASFLILPDSIRKNFEAPSLCRDSRNRLQKYQD